MDKKYDVKMFKICVVLTVILINGLVCANPLDGKEPPPGPPPHPHPPPHHAENTVAVPVYVIYIFGFVLLLLVLLLIFLVFILMKTKILDIFDKNKTTVNKVEQQTNTDTVLTEVKSMKRLNLDRSNSFEFKIRDVDIRKNESTATLQLVKNQQSPITPTNSESSGNLSPRIMKCVIKDMPIILPEQMSQICKEVLIRTNKNEDTGGSLNNIDQLANETLPEEEKDKKYSSTPVLDIYDELPTTSQNGKKRVEDNSITNKDETDTAKKTNKSPNLNTTDESSPDEIYDMPKEVKVSSLNYIEPSFLSDSGSQAKQNPKESIPKPAYALLSDLHIGKNTRDDFKENRECDHYKFPRTDSENLLYINANCNSFSGSSNSIDNKK